jgi:hypothetical protein
MFRIIGLVVIAVLVVSVVARSFVKSRRRTADTTPGLHEHPERLDQMLDPTDDA